MNTLLHILASGSTARLILYSFPTLLLLGSLSFLGSAQSSLIQATSEEVAEMRRYESDLRNLEAARIAKAQLEAARIAEEERLAREEAAKLATPEPSATPTPTSTPAPTPKSSPTAKVVATAKPTAAPVSSTTTWSKYFTNTFTTNRGSFSGHVMQFELGPGKVKVITDTAADTECSNDCPVLSVEEYAKRHGGIAAINGTYFCPTDYASCSTQKNAFLYKIFNPRLGRAINRDNGSWEQEPLVAFDSTGNWQYFNHWYDIAGSNFPFYSGINHAPRLVVSGQNTVDEQYLDTKQKSKTTRAAFGLKNNTMYVVHISNATILDLSSVMLSLGVDYAVNLDAGGSSGMYYNGSNKISAGRKVPNAIIFVEQ